MTTPAAGSGQSDPAPVPTPPKAGKASTLLEVRGLHVSFKLEHSTIYAVQGLDLDVRAGERVGVVGESGSGKSISALSVMQMVPSPGRITGGEIYFDGSDLLKLAKNGMREFRGSQIGMIPQNPLTSLNPVITVEAHFREVLATHLDLDKAAARERTVELLRSVGIPDPATRMLEYPHRLSGGQRQRVMIALAMACRPRLLIADEPTTALDVTIQAQILDLLRSLQRELGMSILLITHDLGVVAETCDEVVVMYAGRVVERAATQVLFAGPRHPYTAGLLRSVPTGSHERLQEIPGMVPPLDALPAGCKFADRCPRVAERCRAEEPALVALGASRVRCHFPLEPA